MHDVRNYLLTIDDDKHGAALIAQGTAQKLEAKEATLIDVVQSLRDYINEEDPVIRSKTIDYLSLVIGALPSTYLSRQQIQVLCQFLCDRIEDGGAVGGLGKLARLSRFNKEMAIMTFRALLEHFQDLQLRPQTERLRILELLHDLMSLSRAALKELGSESLVGITDLVSGEKDPRNLMIVFSLLKVVIVEWDIAGHAETLFDAVFCYFPITFRPPPNDPYKITAQDLKERLRDCVAASNHFAPYAFPQLLDKLDSTSPNVKKDVLQTITACSSSYRNTTMSNYSITLWDSLKYEILNMQEEDLAEEALAALRAVAEQLSRSLTSTDSKTFLAQYLMPITKECNEQLQEPQHKQAKPAGQILKSLGAASSIAFFLIVKATVAPMFTLYQDAGGIAKQRAIIEVLVQILDASIIVYGTPTSTDAFPALENPLNAFKDRLIELFSQALMGTAKEEISLRLVALKGLLQICTLRRYLQSNEIGLVVQYLDEIVLTEDSSGRDDLKNEAVRALVEISRYKPNLIMDITLPAFMARLPDSSPPGNKDYMVTLEALARLSVEKAISDTLVRRLLNRLDVVLQNNNSSHYSQAILSSLNYVLGQRDLPSDPNLDYYHQKIVVGLVSRTILAAAGHCSPTALNEEAGITVLGRLMNLVVRALDSHKQVSMAGQIYSLFGDENEFRPILFRRDVREAERLTLILSTYLMAAIAKRIPILQIDDSENELQALIVEVTRLALEEDVVPIRQALLAQMALLTNKFLTSKTIHFATDIFWRLSSELLSASKTSENRVRVVFWLGKALILRGESTEQVCERLLSLLPTTEIGLRAARGFALILSPDEILSKENGCTLRLLAKQKVFNACIPRIAKDFRSAGTAEKQNYLIALSGILKNIATDILMPELDTLLPLLLQSLDLPDTDVKTATIETLTVVSQESPGAVEGHVPSLIGRLLKSATEPTLNPPKVRYKALRCLQVFPSKVKNSALLPYRKAVTRGMMTVLDDPKRHVRKEAVDCRAVWINMDEPDVDE